MMKLWDWHTGNTCTDFTMLDKYHAVDVNKGSLWTLGAGKGATATIKVPNLLAIPNALVDLLQSQGLAITPHDVLATIDDFIKNSRHPAGQQWEVWCTCMWD